MRELEEYFAELSEPLEILKKLEIKEYGSADSTNSIKENIEEIKIRINKIADRIATDMQEAWENVREIEEIYAGDEKATKQLAKMAYEQIGYWASTEPMQEEK